MTHTDNLQPIHREGLIASKPKGFGSPTDGGFRHPNGVYVVDEPALYHGDQASGHVGVVSSNSPTSDQNYKPSPKFTHHGAGYFMDRVAPLRDAITEGHGPSDPYSFMLPMTPRTQTGAQRLLQATEGSASSPGEASDKISGRVKKRYPLYFREPFAPQFASAVTAPTASTSSHSIPIPISQPGVPSLSSTPQRRAVNTSESSTHRPPEAKVTLDASWPPQIHENYFK